MEGPWIRLLGERITLKIVSIVTLLICIFLIMVWGRAFYVSMRTYQRGEFYLNNGQYIKAITFFDRSIHWYTPFSPYVLKSAQRLWEIGSYAERQGDIRLALIAVRAIRQGFISARSFYTPGRDWIEKCDVRIRELLMIEMGHKTGEKEGTSVDSMFKGTEGNVPDVMWSILLLIGLLGWIASIIIMILRPVFRVDQKGGVWSLWLLKWFLCAVFFFAAWILGMVNA